MLISRVVQCLFFKPTSNFNALCNPQRTWNQISLLKYRWTKQRDWQPPHIRELSSISNVLLLLWVYKKSSRKVYSLWLKTPTLGQSTIHVRLKEVLEKQLIQIWKTHLLSRIYATVRHNVFSLSPFVNIDSLTPKILTKLTIKIRDLKRLKIKESYLLLTPDLFCLQFSFSRNYKFAERKHAVNVQRCDDTVKIWARKFEIHNFSKQGVWAKSVRASRFERSLIPL